MPMEVADPIQDRAFCRMDPYPSISVEKELNTSVMVPGQNINRSMRCEGFEEARDFVLFLPGDLRDVVFDVAEEHDPVRDAFFDIALNSYQPLLHPAGEVDPTPVEVPLDPEVDVGYDKRGFGVFDGEGGFVEDWGDFDCHTNVRFCFSEIEKFGTVP